LGNAKPSLWGAGAMITFQFIYPALSTTSWVDSTKKKKKKKKKWSFRIPVGKQALTEEKDTEK
jgi:hypothetical protein